MRGACRLGQVDQEVHPGSVGLVREREHEPLGLDHLEVLALPGDLAPSREVVLLELAVDYNAILSVEEADGDAIKLVVDLPLEGLQH